MEQKIKNQNYQEMLLEHMRKFSTELPRELIEATINGGEVILNGGDFSLKKILTEKLFFECMERHKYEGQEVIFLSTPSVRFAYDPETGKEIANTLWRYNVTDRTKLLPEWKSILKIDSAYLRSKGLDGLASMQDGLIERL